MKNIILFLIIINSFSLFCQDGQLDSTFAITNIDTSIDVIAEQDDHKILIGGSFGSIERL